MRPNGLRIHETPIPGGGALPFRSPLWRTPLTTGLRTPYGRALAQLRVGRSEAGWRAVLMAMGVVSAGVAMCG